MCCLDARAMQHRLALAPRLLPGCWDCMKQAPILKGWWGFKRGLLRDPRHVVSMPKRHTGVGSVMARSCRHGTCLTGRGVQHHPLPSATALQPALHQSWPPATTPQAWPDSPKSSSIVEVWRLHPHLLDSSSTTAMQGPGGRLEH